MGDEVTDLTPRWNCDGYTVYDIAGLSLSHYYCGGPHRFFIDKGLGLFFTDHLHSKDPMIPMLAKITDKGFTEADGTGKTTVIMPHTPTDYRFYDLAYYVQHENEIEDAAKRDFFDWYWLKPQNCFRHIFQGKPLTNIKLNISPAAMAVLPSVLESKQLDISGRHMCQPSCLKAEFVDLWSYYSHLSGLQSDPGTIEPEELLITGCDGINEIDEPMVINGIILLTIKTWSFDTQNYIDIRLVQEMPEELDQLLKERHSIIDLIIRTRASADDADIDDLTRKREIQLSDRMDKWTFSDVKDIS